LIKIELNKDLFSIFEKYVPEGIKRIENIEDKKETVSFKVSNSNMKELRLDVNVVDGCIKEEVLFQEILKKKNWKEICQNCQYYDN